MRARRWTAVAFVLLGVGGVALLAFLFPSTSRLALVAASIVLCATPAAIDLARRRDRLAAGSFLLGAFFGPVAALAFHVATHPALHVDNATGKPVQLWIDGEPYAVIDPVDANGRPPSFRLPYGWHDFGWSPVDADEPTEQVHAELGMGMAHLYNPDGAGCYWIEATAYGDGRIRDQPHGAQEIADFYRYDRIDNWFGDTPRRVSAPLFSSGAVYLALQRHRTCMELVECPRSVRLQYLDCEMSFTRGPQEDCLAEAKKRCAKAKVAATSSESDE